MPFVLSLDQVRGREALSCGWLLLWAEGGRGPQVGVGGHKKMEIWGRARDQGIELSCVALVEIRSDNVPEL